LFNARGCVVSIPTAEPVWISPEFATQLLQHAEKHRLEKRIKRWPTDAFAKASGNIEAFLMQDLSKIAGCALSLCWEIKPKWGFLQPDAPACRFCMHQVLKGESSQYCPLDLFSESKSRKARSLEYLKRSPQNNLKFFCNGKQCELDSADEMFMEISSDSTWKEFLANVLAQEQEVLNTIRIIQKRDYVDVQNLYPLFVRSGVTIEEIETGILGETWIESFIQRCVGSDESSASPATVLKTVLRKSQEELKLEEADKASIVELVQDYIISMIAKDLSLMITVGKAEDGTVKHQLGIVDIEFKSAKKLKHWYELDQEIRGTFKEYLKKNFNSCSEACQS
jgi:inositol-pentakisphosphate 2-kinase